jgi:hypothetical protein
MPAARGRGPFPMPSAGAGRLAAVRRGRGNYPRKGAV